MLKRIRPSVGSAHVIALLALFAALGGGYATAFSGSGTLQKGSLKDIPGPGLTDRVTVRTLTGVGNIQASCDGGVVVPYFQNSSGEALDLRRHDGAPIFVGSGSTLNITYNGTFSEIIAHISPTDGTKAPQVSLQIAIGNTASCSTSTIRVLALNTQQ